MFIYKVMIGQMYQDGTLVGVVCQGSSGVVCSVVVILLVHDVYKIKLG